MILLHTGAISSSCAQAFCGNETAFYNGTAAIAIGIAMAIALTIEKKADAALRATVGLIVAILLLQHGRGLPITAALLLSTSDTSLNRCLF